MNDQMFKARMMEMEKAIGKMPAQQGDDLMRLVKETYQRHDMLKQVIAQRNDDLGTLSLALKYMLFDLEATRRENAEIRDHLTDGNHDSLDGSE